MVTNYVPLSRCRKMQFATIKPTIYLTKGQFWVQLSLSTFSCVIGRMCDQSITLNFIVVNDTDFWIGAKDIHNTSTFYWPNGARLNYTHWYTISPPPPETCVFLDHIGNYRWLTAQCDKPKSGYICEVNNHTVGKRHTVVRAFTFLSVTANKDLFLKKLTLFRCMNFR